jgi:uncharacterized RDD family membrane protein YckC
MQPADEQNQPEIDLRLREPGAPPPPAAQTIARSSDTALLSELPAGQPLPARVPPTPAHPFNAVPASESFASLGTPEPASRSPIPPTGELPLFVRGTSAPQAPPLSREQESPLVKLPAEPRPPLAVRRQVDHTPAARRSSSPTPRKLGPLDRDLLEDLQRLEKDERRETHAYAHGIIDGTDRAGAVKRLCAAMIDAVVLGGLSALVLWVTLRWCDLSLADAAVLPWLPTAAFLLLMGLGYELMFTAAGGQTLGKMACGLRVVGGDDDVNVEVVTVSQAVWRAVWTLPSVLAFGLGFVPALVGTERALHDRLSHTRVVRA